MLAPRANGRATHLFPSRGWETAVSRCQVHALRAWYARGIGEVPWNSRRCDVGAGSGCLRLLESIRGNAFSRASNPCEIRQPRPCDAGKADVRLQRAWPSAEPCRPVRVERRGRLAAVARTEFGGRPSEEKVEGCKSSKQALPPKSGEVSLAGQRSGRRHHRADEGIVRRCGGCQRSTRAHGPPATAARRRSSHSRPNAPPRSSEMSAGRTTGNNNPPIGLSEGEMEVFALDVFATETGRVGGFGVPRDRQPIARLGA